MKDEIKDINFEYIKTQLRSVEKQFDYVNAADIILDYITNLDEKLDELDTRYRLALMSLVFNTDRSMNEFIEQIDKTIGHKYWNFVYEDDK